MQWRVIRWTVSILSCLVVHKITSVYPAAIKCTGPMYFSGWCYRWTKSRYFLYFHGWLNRIMNALPAAKSLFFLRPLVFLFNVVHLPLPVFMHFPFVFPMVYFFNTSKEHFGKRNRPVRSLQAPADTTDNIWRSFIVFLFLRWQTKARK